MQDAADSRLAAEADLIHQALFNSTVPADLQARYVEAHRFLLQDADPVTQAKWTRLVDLQTGQRLDVEAIEIATRRKSPRTLVAQKIHILLYLAEQSPPYRESFYNTKDDVLKAYGALIAALGRTIWKWTKGRYLLQRYRLV